MKSDQAPTETGGFSPFDNISVKCPLGEAKDLLDTLGSSIEIIFPFTGVSAIGLEPLKSLFHHWKPPFSTINARTKGRKS